MKYRLIIPIVFFLVGCSSVRLEQENSEAMVSEVPTGAEEMLHSRRPNVIFMIGDGMGVSQLSSRWYVGDENPAFQRFKHIGLLETSSKRERVTDSAAGATAYSIGRKSYNGAIGVDADTVAHPTILEILEGNGYNSGLVATSSIVHATPASYYAHVDSRKKYEEIASQLVTSSVDYFAGGGIQFFARREDGKNELEGLREQGFVVDTTGLHGELEADKRYGFLLAEDGMNKVMEGRDKFLENATEIGLNYLQSKNAPFFMLIEGSQIDWGGHSNDVEYLQTEMLDFDNVIGQVLDFAERDGNTIVIVTADHECGGFALTPREAFKKGDYRYLEPKFVTGNHTAAMVPLMAYGPGADVFAGIYPNILVYHRLLGLVDIQE